MALGYSLLCPCPTPSRVFHKSAHKMPRGGHLSPSLGHQLFSSTLTRVSTHKAGNKNQRVPSHLLGHPFHTLPSLTAALPATFLST